MNTVIFETYDDPGIVIDSIVGTNGDYVVSFKRNK
jgi:hypothetical protein